MHDAYFHALWLFSFWYFRLILFIVLLLLLFWLLLLPFPFSPCWWFDTPLSFRCQRQFSPIITPADAMLLFRYYCYHYVMLMMPLTAFIFATLMIADFIDDIFAAFFFFFCHATWCHFAVDAWYWCIISTFSPLHISMPRCRADAICLHFAMPPCRMIVHDAMPWCWCSMPLITPLLMSLIN